MRKIMETDTFRILMPRRTDESESVALKGEHMSFVDRSQERYRKACERVRTDPAFACEKHGLTIRLMCDECLNKSALRGKYLDSNLELIDPDRVIAARGEES